jgi:hypothetical protein
MSRATLRRIFAAAAIATLVVGSARASEPERLALVVGSNAGTGARPALRYAEEDARKLGRVLVELGGFRSDAVQVLTGATLAGLRAALEGLRAKVATARARGGRVIVLFYFSGHSDGVALELGREAWPFQELRQALAALNAEIRLTIIDSCRSGALLALKGGSPAPRFDIRFSDDLATSGEAVLTSTADDEMALESREIRASIFSHHLLSGLRGAADVSGDGRVTLSEAYRYAFVHTLLATSGALSGPQHPTYDFRISGRGELVLTELAGRGGTLELPGGFDRILIADGDRRSLLAEVSSRSAHRIQLPPGRYFVQARRQARTFATEVTLGQTETRTLAAAALRETPGGTGAGKGGPLLTADGESTSDRWTFSVSAGALRGVAREVPVLPALRVGLQLGKTPGLLGAIEVGSASRDGLRESTVRAAVGAVLGGLSGANVRALLQWRVGMGSLVQSVDGGPQHVGWGLATGPALSGTLALGSKVAVVASAGADAALLRRDGARTFDLWPHLFAGLELGL